MRRKTFLNRLTWGGGAAVLLPSIGLLQSCEYKPKVRTLLSEDDIPLLDEISETMLPATAQVPGARAAQVGDYLLLMYRDCMADEDRQVFVNGINEIDRRAAENFSNSFVDAEVSQQLELLNTIQTEAIAHNLVQKDVKKPAPHYFDLLKGLTISGYFTSEIGMTQARNYLPVPGKFESCIPYEKGDRPWAT
ncbi:gluconate 2-dehydrogenase subunit 3 family protein [Pricia sp. S334]|uniref:Gluconate 2-dehydrogenase subunit 3 family protein n=1 Tax=Pricia mediterranea TaxID=3076079 RepID=A0ABU3L278_9FLAO|nr:gluconate 2-dehydrogenase subunit 3 family protein [Pricia sp. S334]MDT7827730.1 gluconate 2-dehydrogenase subunit 3 family protein [Pricia sp. S334]